MQTLRLVPVVLGSLLLAAHVFRAGLSPALALGITLLPLALVGARRLPVRAVQLALLVGAGEWIRTAGLLVAARRAAGEPYLRLAGILGAVAAVTALAAWSAESWRRHRGAKVQAVAS